MTNSITNFSFTKDNNHRFSIKIKLVFIDKNYTNKKKYCNKFYICTKNMIGIFDSGFGWLQTMKYFYKRYPEYNYCFLADTKNCPYGNKSGEEIRTLTYQWLHRLFDHGADIVILACNTAAAYSIRARQEEFPNKKVLSITIPGIEKILTKKRDKQNIGVLATQATIVSNIYTDIFLKLWGESPHFHWVIASDLVTLIESWCKDENKIQKMVDWYLAKFKDIDHLILWCTHFPVLMRYFHKTFKGEIIDPSQEAADKFGIYLEKHPEIKNKLNIGGHIEFLTTGNIDTFVHIGENIWERDITAKYIELKQERV